MLPGPSASANRAADRRHRRANRGPAPCSAVTAPAPLKGEQGAGSGCGYLSAHGEAPARGSGAADGPLWRGWAAHEAQGARAGPDSLRRSRALPSASSWVPAAYLRASRPGTPRAVPRPPARVPTESHGLPAPSSPSPTVSRAPSPPSPAVSRAPSPPSLAVSRPPVPTESRGLPPPGPHRVPRPPGPHPHRVPRSPAPCPHRVPRSPRPHPHRVRAPLSTLPLHVVQWFPTRFQRPAPLGSENLQRRTHSEQKTRQQWLHSSYIFLGSKALPLWK